MPRPAPSELAEHSTSVEHSLRPGYPMPDDTPSRTVCFYDSQTVSDLLVNSKADGGGNPVPRPAPSELAEHSTSVEQSLRLLQPQPSEPPTDTPIEDRRYLDVKAGTIGNCGTADVEGEIITRNRHSASAATRCFAGSCLGFTTVGGSNTDGSAGRHGEPSGVW